MKCNKIKYFKNNIIVIKAIKSLLKLLNHLATGALITEIFLIHADKNQLKTNSRIILKNKLFQKKIIIIVKGLTKGLCFNE